MKKNRWMIIVLALMLTAALLGGCGAKAMDMANEAPMEMAPEYGYSEVVVGGYDNAMTDKETAENITGTSQSSAVQNQKLIRTVEMEVETNDLDALLSGLDGKIAALGGYVEGKSVRNGSITSNRRVRYANLTIRIPVDRLDEFAQHVSGQTNVTYINENAKDITLSYVATQSRITALETEQTRLLELLAKAENMTDLLQIEQRLTDVRTELEEYTSQLRLYNNLVDYGTLHLNVSEVQVFTPVEEETLWQKISGGLRESWENLSQGTENVFVFLVTSLPYLIPIGAAGLVTLVVVKLATRKVKKTPAQEEPKEE